MKHKYMIISLMSFVIIAYKLSLHAYLPGSILHPETPGYQEENNSNRQDVPPIPFTPADLSTADTNKQYNKQGLIGYFWDSKDTDNTLLYPGKARIGNDQFINVVAVDSKIIDPNDDENAVNTIGSTNIMDPTNNKKFHPGSLVKLGTFMRKNDPIIYSVYGEYLSTVIPDPKEIEVL